MYTIKITLYSRKYKYACNLIKLNRSSNMVNFMYEILNSFVSNHFNVTVQFGILYCVHILQKLKCLENCIKKLIYFIYLILKIFSITYLLFKLTEAFLLYTFNI